MRDTSAYEIAGIRVASATEILTDTRVTSFAGIAPDVLAHAAGRGSAVHEMTEYIDTGLEFNEQPDEELIPYLDAYRRFIAEAGVEYTHSEYVVVSKRYRYAGTLDRIGYLRFGKHPNDLHLIDIKCVAQVSAATALQTAGYALAFAEQEGKRVIRRAALQLKSDGNYRLHYYADDNDYNDWLACVRVTNWRLEHGLFKLEN